VTQYVHDVTVHETRERLFLVRGATSDRQAEAMVSLFLEAGLEAMADGKVTLVEKKGSGELLKPARSTSSTWEERRAMDDVKVTPLSQVAPRLPEQGRIRLGEKTGQAMRAIDTFRFTSPDREAIVLLAERYGGTPRAWNDPRAGTAGQWEVKTTSAVIDIALPPGSLSVWYELWSSAGLQRRCDGEQCEQTLASGFRRTVDCPCAEAGRMQCKPVTRMAVYLPGVPFGGVWRMETKSWNALHELKGMEAVLSELQETSGRLLAATLTLEQRTKAVGGQTRHFVVPKLAIRTSLEGLMAGQAELSPMQVASAASPPAALTAAVDAEVVEAEVVGGEEDVNAREWAAKIAATYQLADEDERCQVLAPLVLTRFPWLRTVEAVLDQVALACTRQTATYHQLAPPQRQRLVQVLADLAEGTATAEETGDGRVRLRKPTP
jgi:hypothetical protein